MLPAGWVLDIKAIVTGMISTYPVSAVAWDYGQYALCPECLGFKVYYLEDTGCIPYDLCQRCHTEDPTYGVVYLHQSPKPLSPSLADRWHFRAIIGQISEIDAPGFAEKATSANVLINVSGGTLSHDGYIACPRKVLIDSEPGWNHFRNYPRLDADPTARKIQTDAGFHSYFKRETLMQSSII